MLVDDFRLFTACLAQPERHQLVAVQAEIREYVLRPTESRRLEPRPRRVVPRRSTVLRRRGDGDEHQALGVAIRQRAEQHRIDGAEDRRVGADA